MGNKNINLLKSVKKKKTGIKIRDKPLLALLKKGRSRQKKSLLPISNTRNQCPEY